MADADVAVTSAGRTVFELAHCGVPMIVMCQNERELTHALAKDSKGVINLGMGTDVDQETFARAMEQVAPQAVRRRMHRALRKIDFEQGVRNVWDVIEGEGGAA